MLSFHFDEHVNPRVAVGLRRRGVDVTTAKDAGLLQQPDESHLDYAKRHGRVFVTHDEDFTQLEGGDHLGICYCHQRALGVGAMIEYLHLLSATTTPEQLMGRVEYLRRLRS
jgi:hypothetical protein